MQDSKQNPLTILKNSHPFFQSILRDVIFQSVVKSFPELSSFAKESIKVEHPLQENYGDYSTNIAMTLVKDLHRSPKEISQQLVDVINNIIKEHLSISLKTYSKYDDNKSFLLEDILENISIAGSGFINITLRPDFLITYIDSLLGDKNSNSLFFKLNNSLILIEFTDTNPFKEFHIGHLRNISLGESYSRLFEALGGTVHRLNYEGDVGMHVAKSIWGILHNEKSKNIKLSSENNLSLDGKMNFLGKMYALGSQEFEKNDQAKNEIKLINKQVYTQDKSIIDTWKKYRQWSLDYFETVYKRLGTKFDRYYFESQVGPNGMNIVKSHIKEGIFEESDGAVIYKGEKKGLHTRVFIAKEGYPTYEGKDLGLAVLKEKEWSSNLSVIMTGNEQEPYFKVMLAALSDIEPEIANKTLHVPFGMVNLKEGKMSSRTGNVITADWLLNEAKKRIREIMKENKKSHAEFTCLPTRQVSASSEKSQILKQGSPDLVGVQDDMTEEEINDISESLAVAAVKYSMLKVGTSSDIAFNIDESISLEGDSGPYLMYTFARCKSVFRKLEGMSKGKNSVSNFDIKEFGKKELLLSNEELGVLRTLYRFPEIVLEATRNFSPNVLCTYLFGLAQKYNGFYHKHTILNLKDNPSVIPARAGLHDAESSSTMDPRLRGDDNITTDFRLWLTKRTSEIIQKGLYLLGIETVERM